MDLTAHELCAASALVFGQTGAGIPVAVIRGYEYEINESANVANSLLARSGDSAKQLVKDTLKATSYSKLPPKRFLMRIASWFA